MKVMQILESELLLDSSWSNRAYDTNKEEILSLEKKVKGVDTERKFLFKNLMDLAREGEFVFDHESVVKKYGAADASRVAMKVPGTGTEETNYVDLFYLKDHPKMKVVDKLVASLKSLAGYKAQLESRIKEITVKGHTFVFTGFRDADMEAKIVKLGGRVTSAVSNKTDFVIATDPDNRTGKVQKAAELGVSVMSKAKMDKILR